MDLFLREATARIGADDALAKIDVLMDWASFLPILKRGLGRSGVGPQGYDPLVLFKCLLIGQWHGLSDPKLERALKVRLDFMIFCGLDLHAAVPDETTHCRFRNALVKGRVYDDLLAEVCRQIEEHGLKLKEADAAIIDATLVESAARPRTHIDAPEDRAEDEAPDDPQMHFSADPDARWVKKGAKSTLGYKGFARTDEEGFVDKVRTTPANQAEAPQFDHSSYSAEFSADTKRLSVWLCDCEGLRVEGNFVCGLEQVLPDRGHRHLGVGFSEPKIACAVQAEEPLHRAKALFNAEPAF
jgi:IS5 family transposase